MPGTQHIPWGCHTTRPRAHPWLPIADCACGFDERMTDARCAGCHRSRSESPLDQLDALHQVGDAQLGKLKRVA